MLKHVGRHNNKKVAIVFNQLPHPAGHMALVIYTEKLPSNIHDGLMSVIESREGQQCKDLAEALHRRLFNDGTNMLQTLHRNGWLKKVPNNQVILMPNPKTQVRLDEVIKHINAIEAGGEAAQRMAEIDATAGLADPAKRANIIDMSKRRQVAEDVSKTTSGTVSGEEQPVAAPVGGVLDDTVLAKQNLDQVLRMEAQIATLTEEMDRLKEEAYDLDPSLKPKKRGRPAKKKSS